MNKKLAYFGLLFGLGALVSIPMFRYNKVYSKNKDDEVVVTQGLANIMFESLEKVGSKAGILAGKLLAKIGIRRIVLRSAYEVASEALTKYISKTSVEKLTRAGARKAIQEILNKGELQLSETVIKGLLERGFNPRFFKLINNPVIMFIAYLPLGMAIGLLTEWANENDQKVFEAADQKRTTLEQNFDNFISDIQENQQKILFQLAATLQANQELIGSQYQASSALVQEQLTTLVKSINIALPKDQFLVDPVNLDKVFAHAPMITPEGSYTWFNVSQYGNWQFNETRNSFVQNKIESFYNINNPDDPEFAQNNSIFTEYITDEGIYKIKVECTLYRVEYPFFVGIIFNKARWVSGDPERTRQYRVLGLYGTEKNDSHSVSVHFAQTIIRKSDDEITIISPIKQITEPESTPLLILNNKQIQAINKGATTFIFEIRTSAQQVDFKIWEKGTTEPLEYQKPPISNLEPFAFLYSGIGFMAPGCVAEFSTFMPERLRYSTELQERSS